MRRLGLGGLFVLGFLLAGGLSASVIAETLPTTTVETTTTAPTTTVTTTATTPTTTTTTTTTRAPKTIAARVSVAGVDVGGLDEAAAFRLVQGAFMEPLGVRAGARIDAVPPQRLGAKAYVRAAIRRALHAQSGTRVQLFVAVKGRAVRAYVARLARQFDRAPVDARLLLRDGKPFVTRDAPGRRLDRSAAAAQIVRALRVNDRGPIVLRVRHPSAALTRTGFGPVIVIHRDRKQLLLYRGMTLWRAFGVATGQSAYPTPLGRFEILVMWRNPWWYPPDSDWARGLEPIPPGPGNPLGTRWMGLSSPGVGIHGTPDAASIGYSASHGCIRMRIPEAEWLFNHVEIGTTVFIVGD